MNALQTVTGVSAMCLALAATSAEAGSSRAANFAFACDGTNKAVTLSLGGFPASSAQFFLGGEIVLFENNGGLQYVTLVGDADTNKSILSLGKADNSARIALPTFFPTTANASGVVTASIAGACNPGFGQVQGHATIYFN